MDAANGHLSTLANTMLLADAILSTLPQTHPVATDVLETVLLGLSDTIELLASPAEVPEVEAEARQLLAALAHALYTRMARCTPVSDPSEERARQGAASALKDAEVALSGLVGCLSAPPMRCLGGAGAASLAKAFAQHALLLGRPSALEPAAMLLSACATARDAPSAEEALEAACTAARLAAWLAAHHAPSPSPDVDPPTRMASSVPGGAGIATLDLVGVVVHRGVAAAAGRHLEEASARGALEEVSEAARSAARAGWFSAGAFWCAVAATAPGLAQEARWSAEQSEGIVGAMVAAAAHSWGRSSGGGGSESQAGRLVRALGRMARAGLVGVVTPGVVGAEWTEVGDRAVEFLAWAAGDAGEGDAVSAEAAAAAGQVVAGPEGRRHLAMAQGGGWDPGRAVRRAYTSASERAAMMAARLHGGLTCAVAGACGRKLWRETAVAARALAAVASATPMRCLPARVLEDERRAVVDGLGRAAEAWSGGEESAGAALESLVRCLSGCLSVGGARRGEEDEEELRRLGDLLLELGEREGAAQLRLEALVALRGAAQEMEGAWGREGDVVRLASTLLRQGREELDVKAAQQALQILTLALPRQRPLPPALQADTIACLSVALAHPVGPVVSAALAVAAAGGVLDWPGAGDLTGPLLAKAAEVAQSAVGARPDPGVAPACRVLGQVPPDRRPWAAGVLAGVARGGGTAARAAAAAALASVCEGCATPQVLSAAWPAARALSTDPSDKVQPHGLRSVALLLHAAGPSGPPGGDEERAAVAGTMAEAVRRGSPKTALNACNAALRLVEAGGLSEEAWAEGLARALVGALERGSTLKLRVRAVAALRAMLAGWQGGDAPWARDAWAACCAVAKEEIAGRADGELAPLAEELRGLLRLGTAPEDMGGEVRAAMDALAEGL